MVESCPETPLSFRKSKKSCCVYDSGYCHFSMLFHGLSGHFTFFVSNADGFQLIISHAMASTSFLLASTATSVSTSSRLLSVFQKSFPIFSKNHPLSVTISFMMESFSLHRENHSEIFFPTSLIDLKPLVISLRNPNIVLS
jgi:hypothetical protein